MKKNLAAETLSARIRFEKKRIKKLSFRLKVKVFLTVVLPGLAALLALQTAKTFLRISLRESAAAAGPDADGQETAQPLPVQSEISPPNFITPKPVKSKIIWRSGHD